MKSTFGDLTGRVFTDLTAVEFVERRKRTSMWLCRCVCGSEKVVARDKLIGGFTVSCGCRRYREGQPREMHGLSKTPEWRAWAAARQRCFNPSNKRFEYYGGRGISMCARWAESFQAFLEDMGARPGDTFSLDRIDADGNYEPTNCHWATLDYQKRNKRTCYVSFRGTQRILAELCEEHGVPLVLVRGRINRGWSVEDAISLPLQPGIRPYSDQ